MQDMLTYTAEITVIAGFGFIAIAFILGVIERWNRTTATLDGIRAELDELLAANEPMPMQQVTQEAIAPVDAPSTPAPSVPVAPIPAAVPAVDEADPFIAELVAISEMHQRQWWRECPLKQLRAFGSLWEVKGSARWTKPQAIAYLASAAV